MRFVLLIFVSVFLMTVFVGIQLIPTPEVNDLWWCEKIKNSEFDTLIINSSCYWNNDGTNMLLSNLSMALFWKDTSSTNKVSFVELPKNYAELIQVK